MTKPYISLKVFNKDGRMVKHLGSSKSKRIFNFIQREKFTECMFKVCVNYGAGFKNEGEYNSQADLIFALKAFLKND